MSLDPILNIFIQEAQELLQGLEDALLAIEQGADDPELINSIFRAAHTIKGSAGLFALDRIVAFTHVMESLLMQVRDRGQQLDPELVPILLSCADHLGRLVAQIEAPDHEVSVEDEAQLLNQLRALQREEATVAPQASAAVVHAEHALTWHISVRFGAETFRNGLDPASFIRYLASLGEIKHLTTLVDQMPPGDAFEPETCYLGHEIDLLTKVDKQTLEQAFEFVQFDSLVRILPPDASVASFIQLLRELPESDMRLGQILVECGALTPAELERGLVAQREAGGEAVQPLGAILVQEQRVPQPLVDAALDRQKEVRARESESRSIRVDADKLDHLVNLVGELVIASAGTMLNAQQAGAANLMESASLVARLVEEVRESALRLRMVQIGATFNRFQRVVRDLSRDMHKDLHLEITGGETELDKSVVERIGDPLTHLVRNALDHGIEPADERLAAGKSARGVVRLDAYHDSGSIVIEVQDDGRGLDRDRILAKAHQKGLVSPGQVMNDQEILQLIFEPGFSTAQQVSNLSGRGVGMDVVKRNITALRGSVELLSEPGHGTTVRIRLPLTLAIIDGFLVRVGESAFVIPLEMVVECVDVEDAGVAGRDVRDYVNLRGEVLPLMRLRDWFTLDGELGRRASIVVVQFGGQKAGLVVDELMGEFQTVIKPLGPVFSHVKGVSGATILGSGAIALILDVPVLLRQAIERETAAEARPMVR